MASAQAVEEKNEAGKLDPSKVKRGDMLQLAYWGIVRSIAQQGGDIKLEIEPVTEGMPGNFFVHGNGLVEQGKSADTHDEENVVKCTQHEIAEHFLASSRLPITVCFTKQDGEQRTLRGRIISPNGVLGESLVEDLDLPVGGKSRVRTIYHKQIDWLVANGVRYELKTKRRK
jgi:hypothetical protein